MAKVRILPGAQEKPKSTVRLIPWARSSAVESAETFNLAVEGSNPSGLFKKDIMKEVIDKDSSVKWFEFLDNLNQIRNSLGCSVSDAWFRGQSDSSWSLLPSIYRHGCIQDIDNQAHIKELNKVIELKELEWKNHLVEKKKWKDSLEASYKDAQKSSTMQEAYYLSVNNANKAKKELAETRHALKQFVTPILGEREIFDEYVHKSGRSSEDSSWEILAEMRHHGAPTRLLDWTDQFEIALYFSLEKYRLELTSLDWQENPSEDTLNRLNKLPVPCMWILNPYKLSKKATGRYSIWDITREKKYDYYNVLLAERAWPFDNPVPMYAPSQIERIKSQSGFFTAFGINKDPLEQQIGKSCLAKVNMKPQAAVFAVKYLTFFRGMSDFNVFRDLDTLGKEMNQKFTRMQSKSA
jgi:hypothetical protein